MHVFLQKGEAKAGLLDNRTASTPRNKKAAACRAAYLQTLQIL
jgi:hypothetical protein